MKTIDGFGLEESNTLVWYRHEGSIHKCPLSLLDGCVTKVMDTTACPMDPQVANITSVIPHPFRYLVPDDRFELLKKVPGSGWAL
jgi:hypothetical protein